MTISLVENKLIKQLNLLKKNYGLLGIKSEFEAEGSSNNDVARLRSFTNKLNIKMFVNK